MLKSQIELLNIFRRDIFLKLSILNLSKKLKKPYSKVYEAVKRSDLLKVERIGHTKQLSLLLTSHAIQQLSYLDEQEAVKLPNYEKLMNLAEISHYLIIVTGSYAKEKATEKSDMDLVIIIPDNQNAMEIQKSIENLTLLYHPQIHLYVLNNKDFIEMLLEKKENYGKEIFKNHVILKNAHIYYEDLREAIENGFRG